MGTQIPHGAWATSVACREARLRGRQSEPGNVGDSAEEAGKDPWWASSSEEGEPGLWTWSNMEGGRLSHGPCLRWGAAPWSGSPRVPPQPCTLFRSVVTKPAAPPARVFSGDPLPFCFQGNIPGEQNTPPDSVSFSPASEALNTSSLFPGGNSHQGGLPLPTSHGRLKTTQDNGGKVLWEPKRRPA